MLRPGLQRGMSLLEVAIAALIVAMLASIAVPTYRQHSLRAHRVLAQSALAHLAAMQERFYLQHNRYAGTPELETAPPSGLGMDATVGDGRYVIKVDAADATGFTATATASGPQAVDEHCAEFAVDQFGQRTATHEDCWR
jgi:type IV pilus assembly protein PilE